MARHTSLSGVTLIELIVVIAIISILATLLLPNIESLLNRAQQVICTGKLRHLYLSFSDQLKDGNGWPQLPSSVPMGSLQEEQWWVSSTSNSMGLSLKDWQCPIFARLLRSSTNGSETNIISYLPTLFDASPMTPNNSLRMPWFTELGNLHKVGNLCVRADGSVSPAQER